MHGHTLADRDRSEHTSLFYLPNLRLVISDGPCTGRVLQIDGAGLVIGRDSTPLMGTPGVSRRHAALRYHSGCFFLVDLGSRNGTFLNGARVCGETAVHPGDVIDLVQHRFVVEIAGGSQRPTVQQATSEPRRSRAARAWAELRRLGANARTAPLQRGLLVAAACAAVLVTARVGPRGPSATLSSSLSLFQPRITAPPPRLVPTLPAAAAAAPVSENNVPAPAAPSVAAVASEPEAIVVSSRAHHHHHSRSHRHDAERASAAVDTDDLEALREMQRDVSIRFSAARGELGSASRRQLDADELASSRREISALARSDRALRVVIDRLAQARGGRPADAP